MAYASFFFLNDPATTEIYPLPLHDALPISTTSSSTQKAATLRTARRRSSRPRATRRSPTRATSAATSDGEQRSEEHTSELQSQSNLVCRLLPVQTSSPQSVTKSLLPIRSAR